jgi:tripeptidyl-peptidase I
MALRHLLSLLLVAAANHAAANAGTKFTLRSETTPSPHWQNLGPPPSTHPINLRIGLTLSNFDALETHLYEVSDPSHGRYGQWLGKEEVNELIRPGEESVDEVERWLKEFGMEKEKGGCSWNDGGDWVSVTVPVEVAERMLNTVRLSLCSLLSTL